jgi:hypothetical protein
MSRSANTDLNRVVLLVRVAPWTRVTSVGPSVYELYDDPTGNDDQHFGLLSGTLSPRPAAAAFQMIVGDRA